MSTKRELVLKAFHNEETEKIPVGFWFHFLEGDEFDAGLEIPELLEKNIAGHKKFKEDFDPDFVKIMTDGFFNLPYDFSEIDTVSDLRNLKQLPENHPFFEKNLELVKRVREVFGNDTLLFFNVFSPFSQLVGGLAGKSFQGRANAVKTFVRFLNEDAEAVENALDIIAEGIGKLLKLVVKEGLADGIYLSVNNPNRTIPEQTYKQHIAPSEKKVLAFAKEQSLDNILHICGYAGNTNILAAYQDYDVEVVNWAVHAELLGLKEGKEFFGGKAVIGGFGNTKDSVLYKGTKEEVEKYVENLVKEVGRKGVIIGADCTVPSDIDIERLKWVRDIAATL